jgi:ferritin
MISKTMQDAINEQVKNELYSAYLYLGMSAYAEAENWPGTAHWLRTQAAEEETHAMKLFDFVNNRDGRVTLQAIAQPPQEFTSLLDLFEQVLAHERKVTALIHRLYETALSEKDYAAQSMLQWFIDEQVEEEKNASQIVDSLKLVGAQGTALFIVDRQLGARGAG